MFAGRLRACEAHAIGFRKVVPAHHHEACGERPATASGAAAAGRGEGSVAMRAFLLGAGASAHAGIPTSREMTNAILGRLQGHRSFYNPPEVAAAANAICGAIIGHKSADGTDPYAAIDVEEMFSAVELLAERSSLEIAPFVQTWDPRLSRL